MFSPSAGDFFEPVLLLAAASNRIYRKIAFFQADAAAVSATAAVQQLAARKIMFFKDGTNGCQERGQEHAKGAHSQ